MPEELQSKPEAEPPVPAQRPSRIGNFRFSAAQFLVALVLLLIVTPFVDDLKNGDQIDGLLVTLVLVSGVLAVGKRRRTLVVGLVLALPAIVGKWVAQFRPDLVPPEAYLAF